MNVTNLLKKKLSINSYALKILIGENFISNDTDILSVEKEQFKIQEKISESPLEKAERLVDSKLAILISKLESLEQTTENQTSNLQSARDSITNFGSNLMLTHKALDEIKSIIDTIGNEMINMKSLQQIEKYFKT